MFHTGHSYFVLGRLINFRDFPCKFYILFWQPFPVLKVIVTIFLLHLTFINFRLKESQFEVNKYSRRLFVSAFKTRFQSNSWYFMLDTEKKLNAHKNSSIVVLQIQKDPHPLRTTNWFWWGLSGGTFEREWLTGQWKIGRENKTPPLDHHHLRDVDEKFQSVEWWTCLSENNKHRHFQ